jgi:cell division transport system ATP-binding protein
VSEPVLVCENLEYYEKGVCIMSEVSFRLDKGQKGILLAEPHRCATSLLKICATLIQPTGGKIAWFGRTMEEMEREELIHLRRRVGLVHRETSLISNMTILDNISLGLQYHNEIGREEAYDRITELLKKFELYDYRLLRPAQLNFEHRRLAVYARELVKDPQLYLLEHPSLDLGERTYNLLQETFNACSIEGCAFLVASIIPEVVTRWGDWVMTFDQGRCRHFAVGEFDASIYRESMRQRGALISKEWRSE